MLTLHLQPISPEFRILLLVVAVVAGIYDAKYRRIPNWLTLPGLVAGISLHCYCRRYGGLVFALKGFGLAALIYFTCTCFAGWGRATSS